MVHNMMMQTGKKSSRIPLLPLLFLLLALAVLVSILIGRYSISWSSFLSLLAGGGGPKTMDDQAQMVLFQVRLSRIGAAVMIGAALAGAGSAYQGIFKNPMVSPDILGASAGAGFGASVAISLGWNALGVQLLAFGCGMIAVLLAYLMSLAIGRQTGGTTLILVLTGMVVGALFTAFISIIKYVGDPYDTLPAITFWLMGGLSYVTGYDLLVMLFPFLLGGVPLLLLRWRLNILSLGDEEANTLGVDTAKMRGVVILCATLLSSSAVAVGGMIGWVGLIVPHLARMIAGPDYQKLLPVAMVLGGIFLLVVDDGARCLFAMELPLGVLTAVVGAPFFLYLLFRGRRSFL
ncbi:FecCD family ABC transporter permease [Candidatus Formimonas warabiya]|uniref:Fe3+-siderophore ABC transporter permease n=1 Tax=Formimonas warabiya TaxID=1761012 RepID=A0A3G1KT21_FORW1|nr:iron ABC transporter permease [Candidatus Formimonas warabiya]ATW25599.1 Fe3+-siderophore ABC transporter permease [Candidatus Formimonas warabiya]